MLGFLSPVGKFPGSADERLVVRMFYLLALSVELLSSRGMDEYNRRWLPGRRVPRSGDILWGVGGSDMQIEAEEEADECCF